MPTAGENVFAADYQGDAKVSLSVSQSVSSSTTTRVEFDTVLYDEHGLWDAVAFEFVIPAGLAGLYVMTANLSFESDPSDERIFRIDSSQGVLASEQTPAVSGSATEASLAAQHRFAEGDTIHCEVFQNSGVALDIQTTIASFALSRIRA